MKRSGTKPRLQLFEELILAMKEADAGRVLLIIQEIIAEGLTVHLLTKRLKLRPNEKDKAWDEAQKLFFKFLLRMAARRDTETLLQIHKLLGQDKDFLDD